MDFKRLFIAVDITDSIRSDLRKKVYKAEHLGKTRWVKPDNYHLTLKFLGDIKIDVNKLKGFISNINYNTDFIDDPFSVFELALYSIELNKSGAVYTKVSSAPLK